IRLTSGVTDPSSNIQILAGSANDVLGFTEGAIGSQTLVTAAEVVDRLNATSGFAAQGVAYVSVLEGQSFVTIESTATGAASSSIAFTNGSASAFNITT